MRRGKQREPCDGCGYSCFKKNCGVRMPIRPKNNGPTEGLSKTNNITLSAHYPKAVKETEYRWLLAVLAETLDQAAAGLNSWISIGKNRSGDAFLLTYHDPYGVAYAGGTSLYQLAAECQNLIEELEHPES